jgi:hypothetical protein
MTDWNMRDVFVLCTGRCGHKWVVPSPSCDHGCPTCGDRDAYDRHLVECEPIAVSIAYVWDKLARRRARAIREDRRTPRKTATVVSLTARRFQRSEDADGQGPEP